MESEFCRLLQLTLIDMIIYGALTATNLYGVRWSRVLRPLLLVNVTEGRQVRLLSWKLTFCDPQQSSVDPYVRTVCVSAPQSRQEHPERSA